MKRRQMLTGGVAALGGALFVRRESRAHSQQTVLSLLQETADALVTAERLQGGILVVRIRIGRAVFETGPDPAGAVGLEYRVYDVRMPWRLPVQPMVPANEYVLASHQRVEWHFNTGEFVVAT